MLNHLLKLDKSYTLWSALCARPTSSFLWLRPFVMAIEFSGSGYVWIPYSIFMIYYKFHSIDQCISFMILFIGLMFDVAVVGTMKGLVRRKRPVYNYDDPLSIGPDKYSFPSGHTSRAIFLLFYFLNVTLFNVPKYILSIWLTLVVASRILLGRHYISDVIVGCFVGVGECWCILEFVPYATKLLTSIFGTPGSKI